MTNENVKISVLITTYNLESFIAGTLESVVKQDYEGKFEILVGDDGSTDRTPAIVNEYVQKYPGLIRVFVREREEGKEYSRIERASLNRIMLLKEARGEYISFLDGDDFYTDMSRLKKLSAVLDDPDNADCSMAAHNLNMYYEDGRTAPLCRAKKERKISFSEYWKLMFLQSGALMFRKGDISDLEKGTIRYDYDDNLISFRQFMRGKMYYIPECMASYRQSEGSSWNSMDELQHAYVNLVSMGMEKALGPERERIINIRHYPDLKTAYALRNSEDKEMKDKYVKWAQELKLEESARLIDTGEGLQKMVRGAAAGYYMARLARALRKLAGRY
ncbi:MAG: glycosyltransferase [Lachnospiraceae bacterium]|nr:glycosyltransferase [Lachnospiraceae bacterium]